MGKFDNVRRNGKSFANEAAVSTDATLEESE
jgi:hypothetical protein